MQLYKRLRREYEHGLGSIRGVAQKYKVHRRTVRAALKNTVPPRRKVTPRKRTKMTLAIPFIDAILEKVHQQGMSSLSDAERRQLNRASARLRDRDKQA